MWPSRELKTWLSARFCAFKESPRYQKTDGFHQPYGKKGFKYGGFSFENTLVIVKMLQIIKIHGLLGALGGKMGFLKMLVI